MKLIHEVAEGAICYPGINYFFTNYSGYVRGWFILIIPYLPFKSVWFKFYFLRYVPWVRVRVELRNSKEEAKGTFDTEMSGITGVIVEQGVSMFDGLTQVEYPKWKIANGKE